MTHILFLMSDTGGGHRAACRAMQAAIDELQPGQFTYNLVDVWKDYFPPPFNNMPTTYTRWVNSSPLTYAIQFWVNDRLFRLPFVTTGYNRLMARRMARLFADNPADMIVCAHSVFVRPTVAALRRMGPPWTTKPFITVITDYALPTVLWYDRKADKTLVPTQPALERGLRLGVPREKLILTGPPIHPKFTGLKLTKAEARARLGWPADHLIALLIGGGDGMGPLVETAQAIDQSVPPDTAMQLVVVAGRNAELKTALEGQTWQHKTQIYGFVDEIPVFMRGADLLITKAGPATITEAAILGLPMVLSGAIWFQESPNIDYVVAHNAGLYAPGPRRVGEAVARLFSTQNGTHKELNQLAEGVRRLATPDSIWQIAHIILEYANLTKA